MDYEKINFKHKTPIQIRFNDLDVFAHVNNAVIQEYFDLGRLYYLQEVLEGQLNVSDITMVIASIKTDFFEPVFLEEQIVVETSVLYVGNKSLKMFQKITDVSDGKEKAVCESVMVSFNKISQESADLPVRWRKNILKYEDKVISEPEK